MQNATTVEELRELLLDDKCAFVVEGGFLNSFRNLKLLTSTASVADGKMVSCAWLMSPSLSLVSSSFSCPTIKAAWVTCCAQ